jgi:uncharacterized membrane protein YkoI
MRSINSSSDRKKQRLASPLLASVLTLTWLGLISGPAVAEEAKDKAQKTKPAAAKPSTAKVTKEAATEIALKKVPGTVTAVDMEKKRGRNVYAVEIIATDGGKETDVFVDTETGEVLGTD